MQKLFDEFVEGLVKVTNLEQTLEVIGDKATVILREYNAAKLIMYYKAPADVTFQQNVQKDFRFVCNPDVTADGDNCYCKQYCTPNGGKVELVLYPAMGTLWTGKDYKEIDSILNLIYIAAGRGRVYSSFEKANSTDVMTGAPNRVALMRYVGKLTKSGRFHQYVAAFLNIKNFKWINDKYGSNAGDNYLIAFCKTIMMELSEDELFSRLGGDNFVILVKKDNIIERDDMLRHLKFSLKLGEQEVEFTPKLRAGVYAVLEGDGMHEMMQAITSALQFARMPDTTDFVWYQPYMDERGKKLRAVQDAFPQGLKNNEFIPYYQPKVALSDMKLCGAEALCRWKRGDEFVSPADFIPTLEMDGTIVKLDFYMLDAVCCDIARMKANGINPGKISVNFSKHHIHDRNLSERILAVIDSRGVDHSNIEIELTEMYAYDEYDDVHNFIEEMNKAGITTSLDDFGTGYSSLNMLAGIETDIIKMDKSFLDGIEAKPEKHRSMVKNIINMINELGMESLAEGVETKEQYNLLKQWKCNTVQGFLFDRPMPLDKFFERINDPYYKVD